LHPSILNRVHNILGTHQVWHTSPCETICNYFSNKGFLIDESHATYVLHWLIKRCWKTCLWESFF
jgi:hypothetical protein